VELEADDGLASAAAIAARDRRVEMVCIWTPDKDLAQCVVGEQVVQMDRRGSAILDEAAVRVKYGVPPARIPDFLALVGDAADGYPGIPGVGRVTAARRIARFGPIEAWPPDVMPDKRELALRFKQLATLRDDAPLFATVDAIEWHGPTKAFPDWAKRCGDPKLAERATAAARARFD
ncbi:MAG TPA: 5'-3' exonuclease H3TH domain-containing protein, partial [Gemmatimonadota bacterium]|nr:5'-3' exonuclease H3TH domain-containing protein [Gemmatimonadota bacterium]